MYCSLFLDRFYIPPTFAKEGQKDSVNRRPNPTLLDLNCR
jgi:hypothetical protein